MFSLLPCNPFFNCAFFFYGDALLFDAFFSLFCVLPLVFFYNPFFATKFMPSFYRVLPLETYTLFDGPLFFSCALFLSRPLFFKSSSLLFIFVSSFDVISSSLQVFEIDALSLTGDVKGSSFPGLGPFPRFILLFWKTPLRTGLLPSLPFFFLFSQCLAPTSVDGHSLGIPSLPPTYPFPYFPEPSLFFLNV